MDYITIKEAAANWDISERAVHYLVVDDRIPGVIRMGHMWLIPGDAKKPEDKRKYNRRRPKKEV